MKKLVTLGLSLVFSATAASAQVSFNINDCSPYTTGLAVNNVATFACVSCSGTALTAYCSIVMPPVTRVGFVGSVGLIDVSTSVSPLPDWWRADTCRPTGFLVVADASMGGACPTLWDNVPGAGTNLSPEYGVHGANTIRFQLTQVLAAIYAYDLTGDGVTEQSVFKFVVTKVKTVGTGSCAGCTYGACLVLNEISLQTLTDTPDTFLRLSGPLPGATDHITFQAGAPPCGGLTPTRNRTWGAVKAQYR